MLAGLGVAWYAQRVKDKGAQRLCGASDLNPNDPAPYLLLGKIVCAETVRLRESRESTLRDGTSASLPREDKQPAGTVLTRREVLRASRSNFHYLQGCSQPGSAILA